MIVCYDVIAVEHNVGVPMMSTRRGVAFPGGDAGSILSPRDTAGLGVKMVEYVLGGSPTGKFIQFTNLYFGPKFDLFLSISLSFPL